MDTHTIYVDAPGARLAVDVDGDGRADVLLCHGGPGAPDDFAHVRACLRRLGITSARFDQRGCGRSKCLDDRWGLEALANDTEAVREAVGNDSVVIFGHSWGGVVARAWAKSFPTRVCGVLLASPSAAIGDEWQPMEREVMNTLRGLVSLGEWSVVGLWSLVAMIPGRLGDRGMQHVYRHVLHAYTGEPAKAEWIRGSSAKAANRMRIEIRKVARDHLDDLGLPDGVPIRVMFGDRDIYGPFAKQFAERQRGAVTTFFEDCGHVSWHDAPEAFDRWLREALEACGLAW